MEHLIYGYHILQSLTFGKCEFDLFYVDASVIPIRIGRKDDVIIHTSGEKTVPAPIENVLMSSP